MCNFLLAKSKVAPINALSVPRLEMLAAVKGGEMSIQVAKALNIEQSQIYFYSDSQDVLGWINNRTRVFGSFIRDKIGKIHEASTPGQWNYIPSEINPADLLTHKMDIVDLTNSVVWKNGPKFLSEMIVQTSFQPSEQISDKK